MKSKEAEMYLKNSSIPHYELPTMGTDTVTGIELDDAIKSVEIAEHRHEAEIKSLLKAHVKDIRELSRKFDVALDDRIEAERKKAEDAFCYLCFDRCTGEARCEKFKCFIEKLNAN